MERSEGRLEQYTAHHYSIFPTTITNGPFHARFARAPFPLMAENMQLKVDRANLDKEKIRLLARISYLNEEFKDNTTLLPPICANPNDALKPAPADSLTERADKLVSDFSDKSFKNRLSVVEASMIDFKEAKASMQVTIKRQAEQKHEVRRSEERRKAGAKRHIANH